MDTEKLMRMLQENDDFDKFMENGGRAVSNPTLSTRLMSLMEERNMSIAQVADAALLSQSFAYQIFSGIRKPGRNTLISIALVMHLTLDNTQRLLTLAQKGELYPRIRRDAAIIYAFEHSFTLQQAEELLEQLGEASLLLKTL
jgi:transcriptional regulator with XRE-family HTH domain